MYTYYGLSVFSSLKKYLWWKKYLTQIQMVGNYNNNLSFSEKNIAGKEWWISVVLINIDD